MFNLFKKKEKPKETTNEEVDKNSYLFTRLISGIKGLPLDTIILLTNDKENNLLKIVYNTTGDTKDNKLISVPKQNITNITSKSRVTMQRADHKVVDTNFKSKMLATALFTDQPIAVMLSSSVFNSLASSVSNNYDKINYNTSYDITLDVIINNQNFSISLTTQIDPTPFINSIKNNS